jgi:hypothetical protein
MPEHLVTLEMKGSIEDWRFGDDGAVHVLLANPVRANCCGKRRAWFINREGSTRCFSCDDKFRAEARRRCFEVLAERTTV